jgi:hypothetical protein
LKDGSWPIFNESRPQKRSTNVPYAWSKEHAVQLKGRHGFYQSFTCDIHRKKERYCRCCQFQEVWKRRNDGLSTQQINTVRYRTPAVSFFSFFLSAYMAMSGQTLLLLISLIQYVRFGDSEFLGHQKGRLCISTMNKLWLCMYCYLCAH